MRKHYAALLLAILALSAGCVDEENLSVTAESAEITNQQIIEETTVPINETIQPVSDAVVTGQSNVTDREDEVGQKQIIAADDGYYTLNQTVVAEVDATNIVYRVTTVENTTAAYSFSELGVEEDRRVVFFASFLADESEEGTLESEVYANDTELAQSTLASETPTTVELDGTVYRVEIFTQDADTEQRYQYTTTAIATNDTEYIQYIDDTYTVGLTNASPSAQMFFENVTFENGGSYRGPGGDGYPALVDELPSERQLDSNTWIVEYEGQRYELVLARDNFL